MFFYETIADGDTFLHNLLENIEDIEIIKYVFYFTKNHFPDLFFKTNTQGCTILHSLFHRNKNIHIFEFVLDFFKDRKDFILQKDNEGNNILHELLWFGEILSNPSHAIYIIQCLFKYPELFYEKNKYGYTIFHGYFFLGSSLILVKFMFDNIDPIIFLEKTISGETIFHTMFYYCNKKEVYEFVFEKFKHQPSLFLEKNNKGLNVIYFLHRGAEKYYETKNYVLEYVKKNFQLQ